MYQLEKMHFIMFLLNILKLNFPTYNWFCADGSHIVSPVLNNSLAKFVLLEV